MIRLTLPYPPQINHLYTVVRGRKILSSKGRKYKETTAMIARRAGVKPMSGRLHVTLWIYRPRKTGDIDNLFKAPFDAMKGIAWADDGQVKKLTAELDDDKHDPRLEIMVEQMPSTVSRRPTPDWLDGRIDDGQTWSEATVPNGEGEK